MIQYLTLGFGRIVGHPDEAVDAEFRATALRVA